MQSNLIRAVLAAFLLTGITNLHAQMSRPTSLLWRISGSKLRRPSYLVGTIHVTDPRVFNFSDSLYNAIYNTEGLAIEIDPDSITTHVINHQNPRDKVLLSSLMSKKDFQRLTPDIEKVTGKKAAAATIKDLVNAASLYQKTMFSDGNMPMFMDAWLFNFARSQRKTVSGIEDVNDQLNDEDEKIENVTDVQREIRSKLQTKTSIEPLVRGYLDNDPEFFSDFFQDSSGDRTDKQVLIRRNIKMARRIDSLANIRSTFFAVGAAHLSNNFGLLKLLRDRGYTLTPVNSDRHIAATEYEPPVNFDSWVHFIGTDSLYNVQMPAQPTRLNVENNLTDLHMMIDLVAGIAFMSGARRVYDTSISDKQLFSEITAGLHKANQKFEQTAFKSPLGSGVQYTGKADDSYLILRIVRHNNVAYILGCVSASAKKLEGPNATHFFNSLQPLAGTKSNWVLAKREDDFVSFLFPSESFQQPDKLNAEQSRKESLKILQATDRSSGNTYLVRIEQLKNDFNFLNDSLYISGVRDLFVGRMKAKVTDSSVSVYQGLPAAECTMITDQHVALKIKTVIRGNRAYNFLSVSTERDMMKDDILRFFSSISFIRFPEVPVASFEARELNYVVRGAGKFTKILQPEDSTVVDFSRASYLHDSITGINYVVQEDTLNSFLYFLNDSSFYEYVKRYNQKLSDSTGKMLITKNGRLKSFQMDRYLHNAKLVLRQRFVPNGKILYLLNTWVPLPKMNRPEQDEFLNGFHVIEEDHSHELIVNRGCELITALSGGDSSTRASARSIWNQVQFNQANTECLLNALSAEKPASDSPAFQGDSFIVDALSKSPDPRIVSSIASRYRNGSTNISERDGDLLTIIANHKSKMAYDTLFALLHQRMVLDTNSGKLSTRLTDSLDLTKPYLNEMISLIKDSSGCDLLGQAIETMLDSNMMKISVLQPTAMIFTKEGNRLLKRAGEETNAYENLRWVLRICGRFGGPQNIALLHKVALYKDPDIAYLGCKLLFQFDQLVTAKEIAPLAAKPAHRESVYDLLTANNRRSLFPALYRKQQAIAEGALYSRLASDEVEATPTYLGMKEAKFNASNRRFYLFLVNLGTSSKKEMHLAISGAFKHNDTDLDADPYVTKIDYDNIYNSKDLNTTFTHLLAEAAEDF